MPRDKMTSRERLGAIFRKQEVDRAAVKVWAAVPGMKLAHESYRPICEAALAHTDIVQSWSGGMPVHRSGTREASVETKSGPSAHRGFEQVETILHTPAGDIFSLHERSLEGKPGYTSRYMIQTVEDARKFLSIPYEPVPIDSQSYFQKDEALGQRGITIVGIPEAMYSINGLMGSETFALRSVYHRDLLHELIGEMDRRIKDHVGRLLEAGIGPFYGYVGPELCIPPLQSPRDFDEFVVAYEKPLIEMIHDAGCFVWVHCHGRMRQPIQGFLDMRVDVLNPIEPPPMGDAPMAEVRALVGGRMGLEGNIEKGEIYRAPTKRLKELIRTAFDEARGGPFVLCASAGFMEWPVCDERTRENQLTFISCGLELAREIGGKPYSGCSAATPPGAHPSSSPPSSHRNQ